MSSSSNDVLSKSAGSSRKKIMERLGEYADVKGKSDGNRYQKQVSIKDFFIDSIMLHSVMITNRFQSDKFLACGNRGIHNCYIPMTTNFLHVELSF
jgi:hypothetical protein